MELEKFISETLSEIQKGVDSAIKKTSDDNGAINPSFGGEKDLEELVQEVKFDIAVTTTEEASVSAGGGIKVVGLKLGADGQDITKSSNVSRIQFSVPLIPPVQMIKQGNET